MKLELLFLFQLPVKRGIKVFKLGAITQSLDRDQLDVMTVSAFKRILKADSKLTVNNIQHLCNSSILTLGIVWDV
jgi:hypothetical protein